MAITQISDMGSAGTTGYDLYVYNSLRSEVAFSSGMIRTVKPTNLTHAGSTVKFWFRPDLAPVTTPLTEDTDVTAGKISDTSIDVTITEYGAATGRTLKAQGTDMIGLDPSLARLNGLQAADSYELLARNALMANTNVVRPGDKAQNALLATDTLDASDVRKVVAQMRSNSVGSFGGKYIGMVAPETSLDLREQTGDAAWVTSRNYQDITGINSGEIGTFGGVIFYETPRVALLADAGDTNVDVYQNVIVGQEALACAYAQRVSGEAPTARVSPVTDKLSRFMHVGWYWLGGFAAFRSQASVKLETASSIGDNA